MSRFEFLVAGADAGRTGGGWLVATVGVGVGTGMAAGGYSAVCSLPFVFAFLLGVFGGGFFVCPGCAIELPSALKKSPTDPAWADEATSREETASVRKNLGKLRLIDCDLTIRRFAEKLQGNLFDADAEPLER